MMIILFAMFAIKDLNTAIISQFSSKYIREPHHFLITIQYSGAGHLRDDQSPYSWTRSYFTRSPCPADSCFIVAKVSRIYAWTMTRLGSIEAGTKG
jgi:hypothetical protein